MTDSELSQQVEWFHQFAKQPVDQLAQQATEGNRALFMRFVSTCLPDHSPPEDQSSEELAMCGAGGICASLMSHTIGAPPIAHFGSSEMKARVLPAILAGDKISALAITEPSGGSDVAALKTTAHLEGNEYVVNGSKMFITSGMRADYYSVAVRTGGPGASGVSLLLIERERADFTRTPLKKMGWWASDTAALHFDNVRVPAANLIGEEGRSFKVIMTNFNMERLGMAAQAVDFAQAGYDDALAWARERHTFGKPLIESQVIRHKLVDMQMKIDAARAYLYDCAWQVQQEMLRGSLPSNGGGAEEIMQDLAAKQLPC